MIFFAKDGKISAKRYSVIYRSLYNASFLSSENSEKMLRLLTTTPFREYIQAGLTKDTIFSHKIGISDEKNVFLDAGIVYVPHRPYMLTVMVSTSDINYAQEVMKEISEKTYQYVVSYNGQD